MSLRTTADKNNRVTLIDKISKLKEERNAVILVHNYQPGEIQDIGDFIGDSLGLSRIAAQTDADVIVFCGVLFMAETASILCPNKTVLLPDINAGCPMADMATAERLRQKKSEMPNASVVCYVNSTAEVKAESDVCCTSANAVEVIASLDAEEILFVPDQHLGHYASTQTNKNIVLWPGFCPSHMLIQPDHIIQLKQQHPQAKVIVHPECRHNIIALTDETLSTSGMCRYAQKSDAREIVVGTEIGIIHRLKKENPGKTFIPAYKGTICPDMKLTTLEKVARALETLSPEIKVPEDIRLRAKASVDKMLAVSK
ncbi:MAG: quinolinate synthase NadA [Dehalococcoidia bacterium]|nr:quinolinate synthase NadA [Dehalococcoidia bacterium]